MAATVGSISIDLSTNAAKFASGFKSSATTVESQSARMAKSVAAVERSVAGIGSTLKTFVGGLAAGAGIASIASLSDAFDTLKQTISEYDEIATNSKQAGLKPETFQALQFAAKQANVEQESFNTSLTIFAKNAGLAEKGTGALYAGLKKLNPQLLQNIINAKDQEERLKLVSDALAQTNDATEKAALAATVFGKSGVEMARFLDQGRASIDAMKKSARDMGIIVPDDLLQRAGELDDKLDVLSKVIHVQLGEAVINLAPVLEQATTGFANFSKEVNVAAGALTNFVNDPSWTTLEKLVVSIGGEPFRKDSILGRLVDGTAVAPDLSETTKAIDFIKQKIVELQDQAAKGIDVHIELADAQQSLNDLESRLRQIQGMAALNPPGAFQGILDSMGQLGTKATQPLPTVTRYGGDPNKITLPGQRYTYQANANGTGVSVIRFGKREHVDIPPGMAEDDMPYSPYADYGSGSRKNESLDDTADNTKDTADNVTRLDSNTHGYFRDLGSNIDSGLGTVNHTVSNLGDLIGNEFAQLPSYLIAALSQNGSAIRTGQGEEHLFGPNYDPQHGSYVGSVINTGERHSGGNVGHFRLPSYADDGSSNVSATVSQPGSNYTLQYYAAPGDSIETTKQKARAAFEEMVKAAASA